MPTYQPFAYQPHEIKQIASDFNLLARRIPLRSAVVRLQHDLPPDERPEDQKVFFDIIRTLPQKGSATDAQLKSEMAGLILQAYSELVKTLTRKLRQSPDENGDEVLEHLFNARSGSTLYNFVENHEGRRTEKLKAQASPEQYQAFCESMTDFARHLVLNAAKLNTRPAQPDSHDALDSSPSLRDRLTLLVRIRKILAAARQHYDTEHALQRGQDTTFDAAEDALTTEIKTAALAKIERYCTAWEKREPLSLDVNLAYLDDYFSHLQNDMHSALRAANLSLGDLPQPLQDTARDLVEKGVHPADRPEQEIDAIINTTGAALLKGQLDSYRAGFNPPLIARTYTRARDYVSALVREGFSRTELGFPQDSAAFADAMQTLENDHRSHRADKLAEMYRDPASLRNKSDLLEEIADLSGPFPGDERVSELHRQLQTEHDPLLLASLRHISGQGESLPAAPSDLSSLIRDYTHRLSRSADRDLRGAAKTWQSENAALITSLGEKSALVDYEHSLYHDLSIHYPAHRRTGLTYDDTALALIEELESVRQQSLLGVGAGRRRT